MSRLFDALAPAAALDGYPKVYQGAVSAGYYVQWLKYPYEPELIGYDLRDVEELRDRLTLFLEGAWREQL